MLAELRVCHLGVIDDQTIVLGDGLTALTGETGAGKTLLVDAITLLTGGSADPGLVSPGADEARVEARFVTGADEADETVLSRVVPASGRSRGYVDGRMVPLSQLAEVARQLVDIHGQHAHQSLLSPAAQRRSLDSAARIDTGDVEGWRRKVRELTAERAGLGGDPRERARQLDLLSYQLREIEAVGVDDAEEDTRLQEEEELLADATGLADAALVTNQALVGDDGIVDRLGPLTAATAGRRALAELHSRLMAAQEELSDVAAEARHLSESVESDPERLSAVGERRRVLTDIRRKYGNTLDEVMAYREQLRSEVEDLASHDRRAADIDAALEQAEKELAAATERLWTARRRAAPGLAAQVETELRRLAMPRARFGIEIGEDPAQEVVTWMLGANPGQPMLPLAKVASGGELARAMLATRLVCSPAAEPAAGSRSGPATLVFDEVDAGIGGEAAIAVGRALAAVATGHQVLVVTHLAQVAAFAGTHLVVTKEVVGRGARERTLASAQPVTGDERVVELARMLSGRPDSESARDHARELLASSGIAAPSPNSGRRRR
ncbi:MAG TPA: DNA repair protein RecN [Acidimicrobiales bacterium]|jgi:DNA repair protein RecN (Recombination protein N)|nr:DNA repair protein RecN [Acidimicrobiales bacterium]